MNDRGLAHSPLTDGGCKRCMAHQPVPDLVLDRLDEERWEVSAVTLYGMTWVRDRFCCPLRLSFNGSICLDVMSADRLLKEAHEDGLTTEFVGLSGKDTF